MSIYKFVSGRKTLNLDHVHFIAFGHYTKDDMVEYYYSPSHREVYTVAEMESKKNAAIDYHYSRLYEMSMDDYTNLRIDYMNMINGFTSYYIKNVVSSFEDYFDGVLAINKYYTITDFENSFHSFFGFTIMNHLINEHKIDFDFITKDVLNLLIRTNISKHYTSN